MESPPSPINIIFVLPALCSGGAERVLITLMNGLNRTFFAPQLIVANPEGELRALIAPDIPVHDLNTVRISRSIIPLIKKLRELKPQIVISTMFHMNVATMMAKPFLPRTTFIIREAVVPSYFFALKRFNWPLKIIYKFIYPFADLVISPAQRIIDEFRSVVGLNTDRHALLPNPVDLDKIRSFPVIALPMDKVHFICAGRLHPQKGFDRLIAALPQLPTSMNWTLTILGQGPELPALQQQIISQGLQDRITLAGLSSEPWPRMAAADAFLLPSRWEGLPNVALESLAVGTPVIAMHEAGGIDEIARLADPGSVTVTASIEEFIAAMARITPRTGPIPRPSLLPPAFTMSAVLEKFSLLLGEASRPGIKQALRVRRTVT